MARQIGYNWQINNFVLGVEADAAWSNVDETKTDTQDIILPFATEVETNMDWLATIRGRVVMPGTGSMIYGTGGVAFAHVETDVNEFIGG